MSTKGKILVIASHPKSLIIFREHLLREFIRSGYEVSACSPWNDDATISKLHTMGIHYHNIPMKGQGFNIFWDIYSLYKLIRLVQKPFKRYRHGLILLIILFFILPYIIGNYIGDRPTERIIITLAIFSLKKG